MKLAILGGSFNPVHLGHLFLADTVLSTLNYDRVVLVPAFCSPFKSDAGIEGGADDRLEMVAASVAGDHRIAVDGCEIDRGGVSYTAETIEDFILRYAPDGKPGLIIGDDLAADFSKWKRSDDILAMADIIIARRVHSDKLNVSYPNVQIYNDVMNISSAAVREKIAAGAAWRSLVPSAAGIIIEDRGLYGFKRQREDGTGDGSPGPEKNLVVRIEEAVRESLNLEKFLHSRNTALLARDMCSRLGPVYAAAYGEEAALSLNPELGYLAGIAHDLAKQLNNGEMLRLAEKDGKKITRLEKDKPNLLHGRASAVLLKERFGINNDAVLEAVAFHTLGDERMGPLAKVVFIADKTEVSRDIDNTVRKQVYYGNDLDKIFLMVLERHIAREIAKKHEIPEGTLRFLEKMKKIQSVMPQENP